MMSWTGRRDGNHVERHMLTNEEVTPSVPSVKLADLVQSLSVSTNLCVDTEPVPSVVPVVEREASLYTSVDDLWGSRDSTCGMCSTRDGSNRFGLTSCNITAGEQQEFGYDTRAGEGVRPHLRYCPFSASFPVKRIRSHTQRLTEIRSTSKKGSCVVSCAESHEKAVREAIERISCGSQTRGLMTIMATMDHSPFLTLGAVYDELNRRHETSVGSLETWQNVKEKRLPLMVKKSAGERRPGKRRLSRLLESDIQRCEPVETFDLQSEYSADGGDDEQRCTSFSSRLCGWTHGLQDCSSGTVGLIPTWSVKELDALDTQHHAHQGLRSGECKVEEKKDYGSVTCKTSNILSKKDEDKQEETNQRGCRRCKQMERIRDVLETQAADHMLQLSAKDETISELNKRIEELLPRCVNLNSGPQGPPFLWKQTTLEVKDDGALCVEKQAQCSGNTKTIAFEAKASDCQDLVAYQKELELLKIERHREQQEFRLKEEEWKREQVLREKSGQPPGTQFNSSSIEELKEENRSLKEMLVQLETTLTSMRKGDEKHESSIAGMPAVSEETEMFRRREKFLEDELAKVKADLSRTVVQLDQAKLESMRRETYTEYDGELQCNAAGSPPGTVLSKKKTTEDLVGPGSPVGLGSPECEKKRSIATSSDGDELMSREEQFEFIKVLKKELERLRRHLGEQEHEVITLTFEVQESKKQKEDLEKQYGSLKNQLSHYRMMSRTLEELQSIGQTEGNRSVSGTSFSCASHPMSVRNGSGDTSPTTSVSRLCHSGGCSDSSRTCSIATQAKDTIPELSIESGRVSETSCSASEAIQTCEEHQHSIVLKNQVAGTAPKSTFSLRRLAEHKETKEASPSRVLVKAQGVSSIGPSAARGLTRKGTGVVKFCSDPSALMALSRRVGTSDPAKYPPPDIVFIDQKAERLGKEEGTLPQPMVVIKKEAVSRRGLQRKATGFVGVGSFQPFSRVPKTVASSLADAVKTSNPSLPHTRKSETPSKVVRGFSKEEMLRKKGGIVKVSKEEVMKKKLAMKKLPPVQSTRNTLSSTIPQVSSEEHTERILETTTKEVKSLPASPLGRQKSLPEVDRHLFPIYEEVEMRYLATDPPTRAKLFASIVQQLHEAQNLVKKLKGQLQSLSTEQAHILGVADDARQLRGEVQRARGENMKLQAALNRVDHVNKVLYTSLAEAHSHTNHLMILITPTVGEPPTTVARLARVEPLVRALWVLTATTPEIPPATVETPYGTKAATGHHSESPADLPGPSERHQRRSVTSPNVIVKSGNSQTDSPVWDRVREAEFYKAGPPKGNALAMRLNYRGFKPTPIQRTKHRLGSAPQTSCEWAALDGTSPPLLPVGMSASELVLTARREKRSLTAAELGSMRQESLFDTYSTLRATTGLPRRRSLAGVKISASEPTFMPSTPQ